MQKTPVFLTVSYAVKERALNGLGFVSTTSLPDDLYVPLADHNIPGEWNRCHASLWQTESFKLREAACADGLPDHSLACLIASDPNVALTVHSHHRKRVAVTLRAE